MGGVDAEADSLAAFGLYNPDSIWLSDFSLNNSGRRVLHVWPENIPALNLFLTLRTQWRVGMNGRYGLDYNCLGVVFEARGIKKKQRGKMFDAMQLMEFSALEEFKNG